MMALELNEAQRKTLQSMVGADDGNFNLQEHRTNRKKQGAEINIEWSGTVGQHKKVAFSAHDFKHNAAADQIYK